MFIAFDTYESQKTKQMMRPQTQPEMNSLTNTTIIYVYMYG